MKVWLTTADDEFCRWLSGAANEKPKINGCLATGEDEFRSCVLNHMLSYHLAQ